MYILEYCNDPEHADLKDGHRNFDAYIPLEFNNALNALDRFLYLTDMHRIIACKVAKKWSSGKSTSIFLIT